MATDWRKLFYAPMFFWVDFFSSALQEEASESYASLSFVDFTIENYKSVKKRPVNIPLFDGKLVVLLGLNETGKTTILKAIESFDYRNDPSKQEEVKRMFTGIRNKGETYSNESAKITATIKIDGEIGYAPLWSKINQHSPKKVAEWGITEENVAEFIREVNRKKDVRISRVIPFENGAPRPTFYDMDLQGITGGSLNEEFVRLCACYIVSLCPYVIYFEDFQDTVPEKVYVSSGSDAFRQDWVDIIEGLFYDTGKELSIQKLQDLHDPRNPRNTDAKTVLQKINSNLNKKFTKQWKNLSGVKDIRSAHLEYDHPGQYFQILIRDKDDTMYSVTDRSRGAIWYVSFLMKTEFRRKKMRAEVGRLVYLIDEPASNLHPAAQQNMLKDFTKLAADACVIYTTHSRYLVSPDNMRTTYIVSKTGGKLSCDRIGSYWQKPGSQETYYQPIADCLNIRPHYLDMQCDKALIVEGPSDMAILTAMYKVAGGDVPNFAIYPAGGAHSMDTLISLNLGWGAALKILLDSDQEGKSAKNNYVEKFDLKESDFVQFPDGVKEIENLFDPKEVAKLWSKCYESEVDTLTKKQLCIMFSHLCNDDGMLRYARRIIGKNTVQKFKEIFERHLFGSVK